MNDITLGSLILVLAGLATGLFLVRRSPSDRAFTASVFTAALAVRVVAATGIHLARLATQGNGALFQDDYTNDLVAGWLVRIIQGEPLSVFLGHEHLLSDTYVYLLSLLYLLLGQDPLAAKLLSAVVGALAVLVTYDLAHTLGGRGAARVAAVFVAAFPSLILWTSLAIKEGLIVFLLLVFLQHLTHLADGNSTLDARRLAWLLVAAVLLGSLRFPAIAVVFGLVPLVALWRFLGRPGAVRDRLVTAAAIVVLVVAGVGVMLLTPPGRLYLGGTSLSQLPRTIQLKRVLMGERGGSSLLETEQRDREVAEANPATMWDVLGYVPEGMADALLSPFPWTARGVQQRLMGLEMIGWYALLGLAVMGALRLWSARRAQVTIILLYLLAQVLIMAIFDTNLGTLVRHRTALYGATFALAAVAVDRLLQHRLARSVQAHRVLGSGLKVEG